MELEETGRLYFDLKHLEEEAKERRYQHEHQNCQHHVSTQPKKGKMIAPPSNILSFLILLGSFDHVLERILTMVDGAGLQSLARASQDFR